MITPIEFLNFLYKLIESTSYNPQSILFESKLVAYGDKTGYIDN